MSDGPRFVADVMLGKLARWLRVIGSDVLYDRSLDDDELLALARREARILLTRDGPLAARSGADRALFVNSVDFRRQLAQVVQTFELNPWSGWFTRCVDCNAPLDSVPRQDVRERVPPYVYRTHLEFKHCRRCDKLLWGGTHRDSMERTLRSIFRPPDPSGTGGGDV